MNYGISLLMIMSVPLFAAHDVALQVSAQAHDRLKIFVALCSPHDRKITTLLPDLKRALEFTEQFEVVAQPMQKMPSKQELLAFWQQGYPYIFFLESDSQYSFSWRLYDTSSAQMIKGKRQHANGNAPRGWAYALADAWWQELTGNAGFFECKIAYCKEVAAGRNRRFKHIYMADFDGSHEELMVATPTISMAPRWNGDAARPLLFYSESTNANIRMMAVTMDKHRIMASNFDGLNMLPTFSADGRTVVYCASRGKGNCQLYQWKNKEIKRITNNEGNNICPSLVPDGKMLFFASDFPTGLPQIYVYYTETQALERITTGGYCVAPSYCPESNTLAYSKMVGGIMQLFEYNFKTKGHRQLTFDKANKEECSWVPGGSYLLCPVDDGKKSRIALFSPVTKKYTYVTQNSARCSYPAISQHYQVYPTLLG